MEGHVSYKNSYIQKNRNFASQLQLSLCLIFYFCRQLLFSDLAEDDNFCLVEERHGDYCRQSTLNWEHKSH